MFDKLFGKEHDVGKATSSPKSPGSVSPAVTQNSITDIIRFDNTYSWTRSKTIRYLIEVLEPEDGYSIPGSSSSQSLSSQN